jgi:hypothetical protein
MLRGCSRSYSDRTTVRRSQLGAPPKSGSRVTRGSDRRVCEDWKAGKDRLRKSRSGNFLASNHKEGNVLAIAGTGYGLIGLLVIVLLVVLIFYFMRGRA